MELPEENTKYTYADCLSWSDNERWEIIEGHAYNMSPAPSKAHQRVAGAYFHTILYSPKR